MALSSDASAWRKLRKPRISTRRVGRPRKNEKLNMFYGYPAELIAAWCAVAVSTAYAYKTGSLRPSKPAAKLFRLHRDRIVLKPEWRGWFVTRISMFDPEGNATSHGLLQSYHLTLRYRPDFVRDMANERGIETSARLLNAV